MRKVIVAGVFLILAALILAAGNRYEMVAESERSYRLDKWTGKVVVIAGPESMPVELP